MPRLLSPRVARLLTALAPLAVGLAAQTPHAVDAAGPELRLRPNDGPPGIAVQARGRDFSPGATGTIIWDADGTSLGDFTADDDGDFEVTIAIPNAPAGDYTVTATAGDESASDEFEIEASEDSGGTGATPPSRSSNPPASIASPSAAASSEACPTEGTRRVEVTNAAELDAALAGAQPGDLILLADGTYPGLFEATTNGTPEARITLCGSRNAVIDGGDVGNGYAFHLTADYWTIHGLTVTNALKGIMADDADFTIVEQVDVNTIGHEAVHFRTNSSDNVIQDSDIHDTGLKRDKFGEGVYLGSAVSNWGKYTNGDPDQSDRNQVLRNRIWNTTAECIDVKEGTTGGLIEGNVFDGSMLSGADSWVDVKGNTYTVRNNTGANSPKDGFQTHVINDMPWGRDNLFDENVADVNGSGYGFYIHNPEASNNTVGCSNQVSEAESGFANVECT